MMKDILSSIRETFDRWLEPKRNPHDPLEKNLAAEASRERKIKRLLIAVVAAIVALAALVYVVSVMNNKFGSFTISVNKYHQIKYGLALCENGDFSKPTASLNCRASEMITNIDGETLDNAQLGINDGVDSGENYLCYTFYCRNTGEEYITFESYLNIAQMTLGVENAIRIRIFTSVNGLPRTMTDYARAAYVAEDGTVVPEEGTTPFYSKNIIAKKEYTNFAPGDTIKYTVVIWLEGNDEDCVDNILGGEFKVDFKFTVTGHSDTLITE